MIKEQLNLKGTYKFILREYADNNILKKVEITEADNLVTIVGRAAVLNNLIQSVASATWANILALGTSSVAANVNDTRLGTETYRQTINSNFLSGTSVVISTTIPVGTTGVGTYTEVGLFLNGSLIANSGTLFSHITGQSITKTANASLTIEYTINLNTA